MVRQLNERARAAVFSRTMSQGLILLLLAILTGFAATLLIGRRPGVGRILFALSSEHGVHAGDLPVIALWLLGMTCGALLWRDSRSS